MNFNSICFANQSTLLKYINEYYLFYSIIILTFASVFLLTWILSEYTFFEKQKIASGKSPKFPYGNFRDVIKQETSLHVFIWKNYLRFKEKKCKFGGLFLFVKPIIVPVLILDNHENDNNNSAVVNLNKNVLNKFVSNFACSIKAPLEENLEDNHLLVLKEFLFESTCLLFGFQPHEIVEDVNKILKEKYEASFKYYLNLLMFDNNKKILVNKNIMSEIVKERKKNDIKKDDLIDLYVKLLNETNSSLEEVTREIFILLADVLSYSFSTILFCLYELANNKDVQEELIGEIRRFNKKNKNFTNENLEELIYLEAVIKETLRKYPPVATEIFHKEFQNKNFLTFKSILGVHRNAEFYIKPAAFDPDRFSAGQVFVPGTFTPFGCTGNSHLYMKIITLQVTLVLLSVFSNLEVKMKDGIADNFKFNTKLLYLSPCEDLNLIFSKINL